MRRLLLSLPLEMLGDRLVMLTLTYPGDWERWVPDGRVWERHRRAFAARWERRWGPLIGFWAKEFQKSGRPHLHLYVAVPDAVSDEDYDGLRERTKLRSRLERQYGRYEGRAKCPAIGGQYGGEFAMWLRTAWSEVVKTQGVVSAHHARGVDVAVSFWTDEQARTKDRVEVAAYLGAESAKWSQKAPPEGFTGVGQYYGRWGKAHGFNPVAERVALDEAVALEVEARLARWVRLKLLAWRRGAPERAIGFDARREGDGVTAFGLGPEAAARILRYSEAAVLRRTASGRQARRADSREAAGARRFGAGMSYEEEMEAEYQAMEDHLVEEYEARLTAEDAQLEAMIEEHEAREAAEEAWIDALIAEQERRVAWGA
ncbi:MAG: hypothetical protein QOE35_1907 [Actinomycetota bacterium]|jgi:hypothetical protein